jgi:fumarate hydratase class II
LEDFEMEEESYRIESDSMGEVQVPAAAYYGAQTQRAVQNFPISGLRFPREFIRAMGLIKRAAARVNLELGFLSQEVAGAIIQAATEATEGELDEQFPVDIFQTGSGTSTNMNANEVIANRAIEILGGEVGSKTPVHPNDHVNRGQSSNDVIPTAIHLALAESIKYGLLPVNILTTLSRSGAPIFRMPPRCVWGKSSVVTPVKWSWPGHVLNRPWTV